MNTCAAGAVSCFSIFISYVPPFPHFDPGKAVEIFPVTTAPLTPSYLNACDSQNVHHEKSLFGGRTDSKVCHLTETNSNRRSKGRDIAVLPTLFDWQLIKIQKQHSSELLAWKMQIRLKKNPEKQIMTLTRFCYVSCYFSSVWLESIDCHWDCSNL